MSLRAIPEWLWYVRYVTAVVHLRPILERKRVCKFYSNLVPIGTVLEWFQLREYIHHGLYFRPILERKRVREFIFNGRLLERTSRLRLCRRHVEQFQQLLQYAKLHAEWLWFFVLVWSILERVSMRKLFSVADILVLRG